MKSFEASGRTVEEAISAGLQENGLSIGDVNVEILEEGSKGLFGLFGSRNARVRLTLIDDESHADAMDVFKDSLANVKTQHQPEKTARPVREERKPKSPKPAAERTEKPAPPTKEDKKPAPEKQQKSRARKQRERKQPPREEQAAPPAPNVARETRELTVIEQPEPDSPAGIAQQFLLELTALMGLEIGVSMALDADGHVFATLDGDPQGILIGRRGETLDALQYLTSLKINKGRENYVRVTIDSEGYRQKREEVLIRLANRMANRARKTGRRVSMDPMNPYERRIFHSALQSTPGIATHSEGEEPNRHIVITPVKDNSAPQ
ncbi:MAG: RNA-binding cell elongation regulator Jag/EloR [Christensenellales bacterium]|jgi:spoIIIJ-associated protein